MYKECIMNEMEGKSIPYLRQQQQQQQNQQQFLSSSADDRSKTLEALVTIRQRLFH